MSVTINVSVHRPAVRSDYMPGVYRLDTTKNLVITLGGPDGTVTLFATDDEWGAIVNRVDAFRESEHPKPVCTVCGDTDEWCDRGPFEHEVADTERAELSQWFACVECGHATERIDSDHGDLCHGCYTHVYVGDDDDD